jgi:hypothetical protein
LPRLRKVTARYTLAGDALDLPFGKELNRLPSLDRPELKKLAGRVSSWLSQAFCDFTDTLDGATQDDEELARRAGLAFVHMGELVKLINFTAPYWGAYLADKLTERQAHSGILRMMAPEWWYLRLKRVRDVQREHLAIAVGQVQKSASAYVSRKTLGEWIDQKKRNLEFLKNSTC